MAINQCNLSVFIKTILKLLYAFISVTTQLSLFLIIESYLIAGIEFGGRCSARVQTAESSNTQLHHITLFPVQSRLGLDHPDTGDVHGHIYTVRRRFSAQRAGLQHQKIEKLRPKSDRNNRLNR